LIQNWPPHFQQAQPVVLDFDIQNLDLDKLSLTRTGLGKCGENIIAKLYANSSWCLIAKNFRVRGSEIDLVVKNEKLAEIRILEVKTRLRHNFDINRAEDLISSKKLASLKFGSKILMQNLPLEDQNLNWSLDIVALTPANCPKKIRITTWVNAFDLN